ncbi:class I SAM-dependent RNA methyltransferase [Brachybacterium sp. EF45031]|uniref:class I SAM-dependent RNA methyltransferase n=1 Tax=Brachybacterium sillae TaxID=2810536 RepID=UPI00217D9B39|nr:TRAM domain-containing protein [Brachybacterium sillae]MCS6710521.1 class I SAM-dependent RNA methyltransferase [Brachybacterium sillae]
MSSPQDVADAAAAGRLLTLTVGAPAAGGTFVARHEGRVVFVRGAAPGETVIARLLEDPRDAADARFWRAETVEVLEASVDRVPSVWPEAGFGGVGAAEWAHIALPAQRRLATEVLQDLLRRAGVHSVEIDDVQVEPAPGDHDGLGTRTRERFAVDSHGRVGMRGWRSHEVRPVGGTPLSAPAISALTLGEWTGPGGVEAIDVAAPSDSPVSLVLVGRELAPHGLDIPRDWDGADVSVQTAKGLVPLRGDGMVRERVGERGFRVAATGFWQVHRAAAGFLGDHVRTVLGAQDGDRVWDLFGGVGLFAALVADQVGTAGRVLTVEGNRRASALAAENLQDLATAEAAHGDATAWARAQAEAPDRVVLDPPRAGAGRELMEVLTDLVRDRIVYVSCEPSTLVRDLVTAEQRGWRVTDLRAVDLFPHTHHLETVTVLERTSH